MSRVWAISQRPGMCHRTRSPWSMQGWVIATMLWPGWTRPTPSDRTTCRTSGWNRCSTAFAQTTVSPLSSGGWACRVREATNLAAPAAAPVARNGDGAWWLAGALADRSSGLTRNSDRIRNAPKCTCDLRRSTWTLAFHARAVGDKLQIGRSLEVGGLDGEELEPGREFGFGDSTSFAVPPNVSGETTKTALQESNARSPNQGSPREQSLPTSRPSEGQSRLRE
jgi:hypothetical protein